MSLGHVRALISGIVVTTSTMACVHDWSLPLHEDPATRPDLDATAVGDVTLVTLDGSVKVGESSAPSEGGMSGCHVQKTGPKSGSMATSAGAGEPWSSPTNALLGPDDAPAQVTVGPGKPKSATLLIQRFGFTVPETAGISGVVVSVRQRAVMGNVDVGAIQLAPSGALAGNNLRDTVPLIPRAYEVTRYGDVDVKWGLALTPSIVNDPSFGVGFRADSELGIMSGADVDQIAVEISYCE